MDISNVGAASSYQYQSKATSNRVIYGNNAVNGTVSFYGASMAKEQSDKLQSVIKDLEEQPNGNLGDSWNVGAYAQLDELVKRFHSFL